MSDTDFVLPQGKRVTEEKVLRSFRLPETTVSWLVDYAQRRGVTQTDVVVALLERECVLDRMNLPTTVPVRS